MTFGSQRLSQTATTNLLALYNDTGPTVFGEVFAIRGRVASAAFDLPGATGASGNRKRPSFVTSGEYLALPGHNAGIHVYYRAGTNTWALYDTANLTQGTIDTADIQVNPTVVAFNPQGTLLAVAGNTDTTGICTILRVPTDVGYTWSTVPTDTWAGFESDQWTTDTWDTVPSDTWAGFVNDDWETVSDTQFTVDHKPVTGNDPVSINDLRFSDDGVYLAMAHARPQPNTNSFSPFSVYKIVSGTYSRLGNPSTLPAGQFMNAVSWSPNAEFLAVGGFRDGSTTTFLTIYSRSGDTLTKITDPASMPSAIVDSLQFDPSGTILIVGMRASPFVKIYSRSGSTFTSVADPAVMPADRVTDICFSRDGSYVLLALSSSSSLYYRRNGTTLTSVTSLGDSFGAAIWPKALTQR